MGTGDDQVSGLGDFPPIPHDGLGAVLSGWTGRGSIFDALGAPFDERSDRQWSEVDMRRRANRVLLSRLESALIRLPDRTAEWLNHVPGSKSRARIAQPNPFSGTAWAQTRRMFGWPPTAFVGKRVERGADTLAVQVLRWFAERVKDVWDDNVYLAPDQEFKSAPQVRALLAALEFEPLKSSVPGAPTPVELRALSREGSPWGAVADAANLLIAAEKSVEFLLFDLLAPDEQIRWRLFHLAVLGTVIHSLRSAGCRVVSKRPLSARSGSPNYEVRDPNGAQLLLWFESSGVWSHQGVRSPFIQATTGVRGVRRSNGADIFLLRPGRAALILECKYSWHGETVARDGYYQAMAYGVEARTRLADFVVAAAVGPETVVREPSWVDLQFGRLLTLPPSGLHALVTTFLQERHADALDFDPEPNTPTTPLPSTGA